MLLHAEVRYLPAMALKEWNVCITVQTHWHFSQTHWCFSVGCISKAGLTIVTAHILLSKLVQLRHLYPLFCFRLMTARWLAKVWRLVWWRLRMAACGTDPSLETCWEPCILMPRYPFPLCVCLCICLSHPVVHTYPWRHAEHCTLMSRHPTLSSVCVSPCVHTYPWQHTEQVSLLSPGQSVHTCPWRHADQVSLLSLVSLLSPGLSVHTCSWEHTEQVSLLSPGLSVHTCPWEHTEQVSILSPGLSVCLSHPVVHTYPLRHLNRYPFYSLVCLSHPVVHTCPWRHAVNHTPCPYVHASPTSCLLPHPVLRTCPMDMLSCVHRDGTRPRVLMQNPCEVPVFDVFPVLTNPCMCAHWVWLCSAVGFVPRSSWPSVYVISRVWPVSGCLRQRVVDCFYIALFSTLEQTHCARMWFYMSE